jgi:hypothetical protein
VKPSRPYVKMLLPNVMVVIFLENVNYEKQKKGKNVLVVGTSKFLRSFMAVLKLND